MAAHLIAAINHPGEYLRMFSATSGLFAWYVLKVPRLTSGVFRFHTKARRSHIFDKYHYKIALQWEGTSIKIHDVFQKSACLLSIIAHPGYLIPRDLLRNVDQRSAETNFFAEGF